MPVGRAERRRGRGPAERHDAPLNDVYLRELPSTSLHISGAHFAIEHADGQFVLVDRGSACSRSQYIFRFSLIEGERSDS